MNPLDVMIDQAIDRPDAGLRRAVAGLTIARALASMMPFGGLLSSAGRGRPRIVDPMTGLA